MMNNVYGLPQLQELMLKSSGENPFGGVANRISGYDQFLQGQQKNKLAMDALGLRKQLQDAQIQNMVVNQGLQRDRLALHTNRVNWNYNQRKDAINEAKEELNLRTALGIGTAAWSAYEGHRRATKLAEDQAAVDEFLAEMKAKFGKKKPAPGGK